MITFTLVPRPRARRSRPSCWRASCSSLVALALCIVAAVIGTAIASPGVDHAWALPIGLLGQHVVSLGTGMLSGVALGAALLASAPGHRLLVRAAPGLGDRRARGGARRPRALARPDVLAGADDRARDERHGVGARRHDARAVDGGADAHRPVAHPTRRDPLSACVDSPAHGARRPPVPRHRARGPHRGAAHRGDPRGLRAAGVVRLRSVRRPRRGDPERLRAYARWSASG